MATFWENSCSFGLRYVSWYKYLIVSLFFSHLGFWSGNLFLIAPFPDLCLLVPLTGRYFFLIFCQDILDISCYFISISLICMELTAKVYVSLEHPPYIARSRDDFISRLQKS